jgi:MFS transporter, MCT family, solute carrier family 16 (monocarboxylic acid transporters), member 10
MVEPAGIEKPRAGLRRPGAMLLRATLAQNVGTGCAFGGLGVSVLAFQDRFDASMGMAAMGLSLAVLTMTALGPLMGILLGRWGLRRVMSTGVVVSLAGYLLLAYAPSIPVALIACGALIGPGAALFAALPPAILAGGWFPHARGRATGIAYLPLFSTIIPVIGVAIMQRYGLTGLYLSLAALHLLLLPLTLGVAEPPLDASDQEAAAEAPVVGRKPGVIMGAAIFWFILLGNGILSGTSIAGAAHLLPAVEEHGVSVEIGAILLTVSGVASIAGSLLAGVACDRWGSATTLGLAGLAFATGWGLMTVTGWLPALTVSASLIGLAGAAVFPPLNALSVEVFGVEALPKVLGLLGFLTIPFTFAMSPLAGWLRDLSGSYQPVATVVAIVCVAAAMTFFAIRRHLTRKVEANLVSPAPAMYLRDPT